MSGPLFVYFLFIWSLLTAISKQKVSLHLTQSCNVPTTDHCRKEWDTKVALWCKRHITGWAGLMRHLQLPSMSIMLHLGSTGARNPKSSWFLYSTTALYDNLNTFIMAIWHAKLVYKSSWLYSGDDHIIYTQCNAMVYLCDRYFLLVWIASFPR